ncbi:MAG: hypothetical protein JWO31_2511, partial [Phycisphaerales bacterium]|nr:hypothetical protein [Phycisphaerales bacterium]
MAGGGRSGGVVPRTVSLLLLLLLLAAGIGLLPLLPGLLLLGGHPPLTLGLPLVVGLALGGLALRRITLLAGGRLALAVRVPLPLDVRRPPLDVALPDLVPPSRLLRLGGRPLGLGSPLRFDPLLGVGPLLRLALLGFRPLLAIGLPHGVGLPLPVRAGTAIFVVRPALAGLLGLAGPGRRRVGCPSPAGGRVGA